MYCICIFGADFPLAAGAGAERRPPPEPSQSASLAGRRENALPIIVLAALLGGLTLMLSLRLHAALEYKQLRNQQKQRLPQIRLLRARRSKRAAPRRPDTDTEPCARSAAKSARASEQQANNSKQNEDLEPSSV
jgi:hypothetical protein